MRTAIVFRPGRLSYDRQRATGIFPLRQVKPGDSHHYDQISKNMHRAGFVCICHHELAKLGPYPEPRSAHEVSKSETSSIIAARLGIAAVVAAHTALVVAFHVISANNASSWCTRQRAGAR